MKISFFHSIRFGLMLTLGVGLSITAAAFVAEWEASNQQTRFQRQIENLSTSLQRSLNRYTDVLAFLKDYYTTNEGDVSRQEFTHFVARSLDVYPGIQALEWAPWIPQSERFRLEQTIQAEGYPTFQITELSGEDQLVHAGDRSYYSPVVYFAPVAGNEAAFGFDLSSTPERRAALEFARDTGNITATGRIRLVQEQRDQFGFLVVLPLYEGMGIPPLIADRREKFLGFLVGVFRVSDVVEEALQGLQYDINFVLYDQSAPTHQQFLGRYDAVEQTVTTVEGDRLQDASLCPVITDCIYPLSVGERRWQVFFTPSAHYPSTVTYGAPVTLFVGLLFTVSLTLFLYQLEAELKRTKTLSDLKLRFFSMASHELRTPLSTILLSAESLQIHQHQLSETQRRSNIQRIHRTAQRMSEQITDLLTLTRSEVGKQDFSPELFEIHPFFQQIISDLEISDRQRIIFQSNDEKTLAFWDKKLVRSLLSNLLSNALKYSPDHGSVEIALRCKNQTAIFTVSDRGIGIPDSDQPHILEAFHRGKNVGAIAGTGLGLAVVKTCVNLHRGHWSIQSWEGEGTIVEVILPLE